MKMTKRIFALILAVMMLAMMIPAVSAAATYVDDGQFTLDATGKPAGYEFTVYQLAKFDTVAGTYDVVAGVPDSVKNIINSSNDGKKALLDACDAATMPASLALPQIFKTSEGTSKTYENVAEGIYYVKCTKKALSNREVLGGALIVLDANKKDFTGLDSVKLATKVTEKGVPKVEKGFSIKTDNTLDREPKKVGFNTTVNYILRAEVTGTTTNHLKSYIITDIMGTGLDKSIHNVTAVYLVTKAGVKIKDITDYTVEENSSVIGAGNTFGVVLGNTILSDNEFYGEDNRVVVEYNTKITADAPINTDIPNTDGLTYSNESGSNTLPGDTVVVRTYSVQAIKVDADDTSKKLSGAEFTLFDTDGKTKLEENVATNSDGIAAFSKRLAPGTYYVQETKAPEGGYNLNTTKIAVEVKGNETTGIAQITVPNTKTKLPATGGEGTLMFTIIGGSLILLAGALFIIVMKKRSTAK